MSPPLEPESYATASGVDSVSIQDDKKRQENDFWLKYRKREWPSLYTNPDFLVLHVSDDGTMTIIRPAEAPEHRKNMEEQHGHYALSHLWGNAKDYPYWDVGDFIKDAMGEPVEPIPMRPEKRDALLALLKAYPGYWWIDVLCARVDTPLVIMGSIYRSCKTCFAMVDCSIETIRKVSKRTLLPIRNDITNAFLPFYKTFLEANNDGLDEDSAYELNSPTAMAFFAKLMTYQDEIQAMRDLLECRWCSRVWTLQELVLPTRLAILSEQYHDDIDIDQDQADFEVVSDIISILQQDEFEAYLDGPTHDQYLEVHAPIVKWLAQKLDSCLEGSMICNEELSIVGRLYEISEIFVSLAGSSRTCLDPLDYVYGILGLLDIHIPRTDNADTLWRTFLSKLKDHLTQMVNDIKEDDVNVSFTLSESACDIKLAHAENVSEIYNGLLSFEFDQRAKAMVLKEGEKTGRMAFFDRDIDNSALVNEVCDMLGSLSTVLASRATE